MEVAGITLQAWRRVPSHLDMETPFDTAVSMTLVTTGFGAVLSVRRVGGALATAAPALALSSLAFGVWYAAAAWSLAPYPF